MSCSTARGQPEGEAELPYLPPRTCTRSTRTGQQGRLPGGWGRAGGGGQLPFLSLSLVLKAGCPQGRAWTLSDGGSSAGAPQPSQVTIRET